MCSTGNRKLAGLINGAICLCLDTVAEMTSSCNQSCIGDTSINCGGQTALRIFNLSTLLKNEPKIQFNHKPKFLEKAEYFLSTVNETTSYRYQLTYKVTKPLDDVNADLIFGNTYYYNLTAWGSDVEVTVIVVGKVRQEFKKTVAVKAPLSVSNIKCPTYATTGFPVACTGQLNLGKEVNMSWSLSGSSGLIYLAGTVKTLKHISHTFCPSKIRKYGKTAGCMSIITSLIFLNNAE